MKENKALTLELIHRNPIPLFYIHTSITLYNNFNAVKKKNPIRKQVLKIYNDESARSKVGDEHLKIYTHTLTHKQGSRTSGVLELYLNRAGLNGEEFSHHRERHIEYTVYLQKQKTSTFTRLLP